MVPPWQPVHDLGQGNVASPPPSRCCPVCATLAGANRSARLAGAGIQFLPGAAEHEREVFHCPKWLFVPCKQQDVLREYLFKVENMASPRPRKAGNM